MEETRNPALVSTVSGHAARIALDTAVRSGIDEAEATRIANFDRNLLADDRIRIPSRSQYQLWALMEHVIGNEAGVRAADTADHGRLHIWDYLFSTAPTLVEGFHDAARFSDVICDPAARLEVAEHESALTVGYRGTTYGETRSIINEFAVTVAVRRARDAFGAAAVPVRVDFAHPAPRRHRYLEDALGTAAIHFDQPADLIHYRLTGPHAGGARSHDPYLRRILQTAAQQAIDAARPVPGWIDSFRAALRIEMTQRTGPTNSSLTRGPRIGAVAGRLAIGDRTLQRRLSAAGTSWSEELAAARRELATDLLRHTTLTVQAIALRVGYTDARALSRAFGSWTGLSPDAYRHADRRE
ncbi:AraC family transcriptional regulator [Nocardia stercoris]|uniref:AraC family transcriptional regulator n=1 Tax=Nocardia stercoris TaxID=2483361 RepID=A0A3M2LDQ1_9NOCA|nr:AraC family transcriptional regulator [Nocardia stercoris]RMI34890.1 AraC family transcriptional regulator [Nocardia stercoris]